LLFDKNLQASINEILIYKDRIRKLKSKPDLMGQTAWLSLNQIAQLFGRDKSVLSRHFKNIFESKELVRYSVVTKDATTASDRKTYEVRYFKF
jgi:hypothetical protein